MTSMTRFPKNPAILLALVIGTSVYLAYGDGILVSHTESLSNSTTTISIAWSGVSSSVPIKDIHLLPPGYTDHDPPNNTIKFAKPVSAQTVTIGGQTFQVHPGKSGSVNLTNSTGVTAATGSALFSIDFTGTRTGSAQGTIRFTKSGSREWCQGDEIGSGTISTYSIPCATLTLHGDSALAVVHGNSNVPVSIATDTDLSGQSYEIYTSLSLAPDFDDSAGVGVNSSSDPVSGGWGLTFSNFTGTINSSGEASSTPTISVPNDAGLIGHMFYAVVALKLSGNVWLVGAPITITIE